MTTKRTNLLAGIVLVGGILCSMSGSRATGDPIDARERQYDHFLFIRRNPGDRKTIGDTLVMAKVTRDGFALKDLYGRHNLDIGLHLVGVARGKVYILKIGDLLSIDVATGDCETIAKGIASFACDAGRLYALVHRDDAVRLVVHDFRQMASRDLMTLIGVQHVSRDFPIAVSPNHRILAYFASASKLPWDGLLSVVDLEKRTIRQPCKPVRYLDMPPSSGADRLHSAPPFVWLDEKTILLARTDVSSAPTSGTKTPALRRVERLVTADVLTGEMNDVATVPGRAEENLFHFLPPRLGSPPGLVLWGHRLAALAGSYRVDVQAGRVVESDTTVGEFRLAGQARCDETQTDVATRLFHGNRLVDESKSLMKISISPDGKRAVWSVRKRPDPARVWYYDGQSREPRLVARSGSSCVEPFLWFTGDDLRPPVEPPAVAAGWTRFSPLPVAEPKPADPKTHISNLVPLTLSCDKSVYRLHEPIQLTFSMTNKSGVDLKIVRPRLDNGTMELDLDHSTRGWSIQYHSKPREKIILKAGASLSTTETIEVEGTGKYQVQADYRGVEQALQPGFKSHGWHRTPRVSFVVEASRDSQSLREKKIERLLATFRKEFAESPDACWASLELDALEDMGPDVASDLIAAIKKEIELRSDARMVERLLRSLNSLAWGDLLSREAFAFYEECLRDESQPGIQKTAVLGLFHLNRQFRLYAFRRRSETALQVLLSALDSDSTELRRFTAETASRIRHPLVRDRFESLVTGEDKTMRRIAARYLAAYEGLGLADWLAGAASDPTRARFAAAQHIVRELEETFHIEHGQVPPGDWDEVAKDPKAVGQFRDTLQAWEKWARDNPRTSERFFDRNRKTWTETQNGR